MPAVFGLTGCASGNSFDLAFTPSSSTQTATPGPSPAPFKVGVTLTKEEALQLRQDMPSNGDYAYAMPDGTWVATNTQQPLPEAVQAIETAKVIKATPKPASTSMSDGTIAFKAAVSAAGASQYATGKLTIVVSQQITSNKSGPGNHLVWAAAGGSIPDAVGKGNEAGGWESADSALRSIQSIVNALPDAGSYEIIVVR